MRQKKVQIGPFLTWKMKSLVSSTADEYRIELLDFLEKSRISPRSIKSVAIASVVPALDRLFEEVIRKTFRLKPFFVNASVKTGIQIKVDHPEEVGADRICNAAAVFALFGGPAIVVDFGTATTLDCVTKKGEYIGGAIAPGPHLASEALSKGTAKLTHIDFVKPKRAIGKNTIECLQSGLFWGYIGLVETLLKRLSMELPGFPSVFVTGGLADLVASETKVFKRKVPHLTLEGLRIIWEKN